MTKTMFHVIFTALFVGLTGHAACNAHQDARALAAITARNNQFRAAVQAGNASAAAALYHPQVIFQAPDIPTLRGRAAVQAFFQQQIAAGAKDIVLTTEEIRCLKSGNDLQYEEVGTLILTYNMNGTLVPVPGKYIVIWDFSRGVRNPPFIFRDAFSFSVPL